MTITEAQEAKREVQKAVAKLLDQFARDTGLIVEDMIIDTINFDYLNGEQSQHIHTVRMRVSI